MGDLLAFGTGAGDDAMNPANNPVINESASLGAVPESESVTSEQEPPAAGQAVAQQTDPIQLQKTADSIISTLRLAAQKVTFLPVDPDGGLKRDLATQAIELESTATALKNRIVMASGSPENAAVQQDLDQLMLSVNSYTHAVEQELEKAGLLKDRSANNTKLLWPILGIAGAVAAGILIYDYVKKNNTK